MNRKILLLLDDEEDLLEILVEELEESGIGEIAEILTVKNGKEGLEAIKNNDVDCVVSDINMPIMNGIDFVREIQSNNYEKPVMFLSAHGDPDTIKKTENLEIYRFIQKPFDADDFCDTVREALKKVS